MGVLSTESVVYCEAKFSRPAKNFVLFSRKFLQGFCSASLRICYTTHIPFISVSSTIGLDPFSYLKVVGNQVDCVPYQKIIDIDQSFYVINRTSAQKNTPKIK